MYCEYCDGENKIPSVYTLKEYRVDFEICTDCANLLRNNLNYYTEGMWIKRRNNVKVNS